MIGTVPDLNGGNGLGVGADDTTDHGVGQSVVTDGHVADIVPVAKGIFPAHEDTGQVGVVDDVVINDAIRCHQKQATRAGVVKRAIFDDVGIRITPSQSDHVPDMDGIDRWL